MPIHANRRGVSLFEAVVAIAIVGMTSVSALEAVGSDMRTAERSRRSVETEALASSRLQFMTLLTDQELQSLADTVQHGVFPAPLNEYSWKTTSSAIGDQPGLYDLRVSIIWPAGTYTVRTYAYRRPAVASRR